MGVLMPALVRPRGAPHGAPVAEAWPVLSTLRRLDAALGRLADPASAALRGLFPTDFGTDDGWHYRADVTPAALAALEALRGALPDAPPDVVAAIADLRRLAAAALAEGTPIVWHG